MRLFEIGDGLKSIKVSANYYSEWENDNTVILYDPEKDFAGIRISVITVEPKDSSNVNIAYENMINEGNKRNCKVSVINEKSFFTYRNDSEEDGEKISMFFFEIGYKCHFIIISVTVSSEYVQNNEEEVEGLLSDIIQFIPTIEEVSLSETNIFEPKYSDFKGINERIAGILNIEEDDIEAYHENDESIHLIQNLLDGNEIKADETYQLQSLGIVMGDYLQYKEPRFHWAVVRDEYGRDLSLQYENLSLTIFPMTMISKRVEDGETVNVKALITGLIERVKEIAQSGDYKVLDHND